MLHDQSVKVEGLFVTAATNATNSTTYGYVDTIGFDHATFLVLAKGTAAGATQTNSFQLIQVREGTNSTAATAIVALTGGTVTAASVGFASTYYAAPTSAPACTRIDVDLTKRERYLRIQVGPGTKMTVAGLVILSRGKIEPGTDQGVTQTVIG